MKSSERRRHKLMKLLWRNPQLIHELFNDEEWKQHQQNNLLTDEESEKLFQSLQLKIRERETSGGIIVKLKPHLATLSTCAASILVFLAIGLGLWVSWEKQPHFSAKEQLAIAPVNNQPQTIWTAIENSGTVIKWVNLPDSSRVKLYPQSSIRFEKNLNPSFRAIYLLGKAYFEVSKDPKRPFSVYAGGLKTTALGTSFTINTTAAKNATSVKLHTGKIVVVPEKQVEGFKPLYVYEKNAELLFDRNQQIASFINSPPQQIKPLAEFIRKGNQLTFKNIALNQVIEILSKAYNIQISSISSINNITYTGTVDLEKETVESVISMICMINDLNYSITTNGEFILHKSNKQ